MVYVRTYVYGTCGVVYVCVVCGSGKHMHMLCYIVSRSDISLGMCVYRRPVDD